MPELPDLVHVEKKLREALLGRTVRSGRTGDPTVLRLMVAQPFPEVLFGHHFTAVDRRGHFMCLGFDGNLTLAINCMLTGKFRLAAPEERGGKSAAVALGLAPRTPADPALELWYLDDKRMGKVYVAPSDRLSEVPVLGNLGVDIISDDFTLEL